MSGRAHSPRRSLNGQREVYAQIRVIDAGGNDQYRRMGTYQVDEIEKLRLARRGKSVLFLYRSKGSDHDEILAQQDVCDLAVLPSNVRLILHTGGDDRRSEVMLKQLSVRAEKIDPNPANAAEPPGLLKSLRKLFE